MPDPTEQNVISLGGFTEKIETALAISRAGFGNEPQVMNWYRGCGKASYSLTPSLYRHPTKKIATDLIEIERKMTEWFSTDSIVHANGGPTDRGFAQLFFMQHYGVPTRLLDWTNNPFIALYFALTRARRDAAGNYGEDAAVWILSPYHWNQKASHLVGWRSGPFDMKEAEKRGYWRDPEGVGVAGRMHEPPIAVVGMPNTRRMFAQKGVFTLFGESTDPMEKIFKSNRYPTESLQKLVIPRDRIGDLLNATLAIGYTDSVAYPDLEGLAMEIKRQFNF